MHKRDAPSKKIQLTALVLIIAATTTIFGCRETTAPTAPASAPAQQVRSKEQAMNALMALPELKAWSAQLEKASDGKVHGALIEYDPKPKTIGGIDYWQFSFVENGGEAVHRWESFLVAERGDDILVEDFATDKTLTLAQWRKEKRPMERTGPL